jgi:hypothetical protein
VKLASGEEALLVEGDDGGDEREKISARTEGAKRYGELPALVLINAKGEYSIHLRLLMHTHESSPSTESFDREVRQPP